VISILELLTLVADPNPALTLPAQVAIIASLVTAIVQALKKLSPRLFSGRIAVIAAAVLAFGGTLAGVQPEAMDWNFIVQAALTALASAGLFSATKTIVKG